MPSNAPHFPVDVEKGDTDADVKTHGFSHLPRAITIEEVHHPAHRNAIVPTRTLSRQQTNVSLAYPGQAARIKSEFKTLSIHVETATQPPGVKRKAAVKGETYPSRHCDSLCLPYIKISPRLSGIKFPSKRLFGDSTSPLRWDWRALKLLVASHNTARTSLAPLRTTSSGR